jgi:hypothetical protein
VLGSEKVEGKKNWTPRAYVVHAVPMRKLLLVPRFAVRARWPLFFSKRGALLRSRARRLEILN